MKFVSWEMHPIFCFSKYGDPSNWAILSKNLAGFNPTKIKSLVIQLACEGTGDQEPHNLDASEIVTNYFLL